MKSSPSHSSLRAGVIGAGPHGRRVIQMLLAMPGVELAAVADQRPEALQAAELPERVKRCSHAGELLAERLDLVCITTNGPSHAPLALAAIEAGVRRVFVEKPMACSLAECDQMMAAARQHGVRLVVDQSRRMDSCYRWLRDKIASGDWGELRHISVQRPGIGLGCIATHSFDLVRFLSGRQVEAVTAWIDKPIAKNPRGEAFVDPGGLVVMEMGPGMRAVVTQHEDGSGPTSIEIDLTRARIRIDERTQNVEIVERDPTSKAAPGKPASFRTVPVPDEVASRFDLVGQVKLVVEELIGDGPLECTPEHGIAAVEILVAAHISGQRGHARITLPITDTQDRGMWLPVT
jgi:predicted dehydrogenase